MEDDPRLALDVDDSCVIFSRSEKQWLPGIIKTIYIEPNSNKEWLIVKYGNHKTKKIQRLCNDLKAIINENEEDPREILEVGSPCNIFSRSNNKWFDGKVNKIFVDSTNKEWLVIKYGNNKCKKIQRFCQDLQATTVDIDEMMNYNTNINHISNINGQKHEYLQAISTIPEWQKLRHLALPSHYFSKIIGINQYEFVIATTIPSQLQLQGAPHGIYKYNVLQNQWSLAVNYSQSDDLPMISKMNLCAFDKTKNQLFIGGYTYYKCNLLKFDLNSKSWKSDVLQNSDILSYYTKYIRIDDEDDILQCLFVDDSKLHMIGRYDNTEIRYTIWDTSRVTFEPMEERVINDITNDDYLRYPGKSVLSESENRLLAFDDDTLWICDLEFIQWTEMTDIRFPFRMGDDHNVCITPDDKYVVFITDKVIILELETMMFYKSDDIKLPKVTEWDPSFDCIILPYYNDEQIKIVTFGYIKQIGNGRSIPIDVMHLITGYWRKDILYLMEQKSHAPTLWRMFVDDILSSNLCILEKIDRHRTSTVSLFDDIGTLENIMY